MLLVQVLLQLEKRRVINVDRDDLARWPKEPRQRNGVETISAAHVGRGFANSELEASDHAALHVGDAIFFRPRRKRLGDQCSHDQCWQEGPSHKRVERSHHLYSTRTLTLTSLRKVAISWPISYYVGMLRSVEFFDTQFKRQVQGGEFELNPFE